jgi:uncharacterized peroxidase-related enzyme
MTAGNLLADLTTHQIRRARRGKPAYDPAPDERPLMPHIDLPDGVPGIIALLQYRPTTAKPLNELAEVLLRGENTLTRGERELIAAHVSKLNDCHFCHTSHATFAALQVDGGWATVDAMVDDPATAPITPKLRALLAIATKVQQGGTAVKTGDIDAARAEGATDDEIHDTVLIAAAFCMYNRYVDGLATWAPEHRDDYADAGAMIVEYGYAATTPS